MSASRSFPAFLQLNLIEPQAAEHRHDEKGPIEGLTGRAEQHLKALKDSLPGQVMSSRQNSPNATPLYSAWHVLNDTAPTVEALRKLA